MPLRNTIKEIFTATQISVYLFIVLFAYSCTPNPTGSNKNYILIKNIHANIILFKADNNLINKNNPAKAIQQYKEVLQSQISTICDKSYARQRIKQLEYDIYGTIYDHQVDTLCQDVHVTFLNHANSKMLDYDNLDLEILNNYISEFEKLYGENHHFSFASKNLKLETLTHVSLNEHESAKYSKNLYKTYTQYKNKTLDFLTFNFISSHTHWLKAEFMNAYSFLNNMEDDKLYNFKVDSLNINRARLYKVKYRTKIDSKSDAKNKAIQLAEFFKANNYTREYQECLDYMISNAISDQDTLAEKEKSKRLHDNISKSQSKHINPEIPYLFKYYAENNYAKLIDMSKVLLDNNLANVKSKPKIKQLLYFILQKAYTETNEIDSALFYLTLYTQSIHRNNKTSVDFNLNQNSDHQLYVGRLDGYNQASGLYYKQYTLTKNIEKLRNAKNLAEITLDSIYKWSDSFGEDDMIHLLQGKKYDAIYNGLKINSELYKLTGDSLYLKSYITLISRNKGDIQRYDTKLNNEIKEKANYKRYIDITNLINKFKIEGKLDQLNKLVDQKKELERSFKHLGIDPTKLFRGNTYQTLYNNLVHQSYKQTIIDYCLFGDELFTTVIHNGKVDIYNSRININKLKEYINIQKNKDQIIDDTYLSHASYIIENLFTHNFRTFHEQITIIPDGIINFLSFDNLVDPTSNSFIVNNFIFTYSYSLFNIPKQNQDDIIIDSFVGFSYSEKDKKEWAYDKSIPELPFSIDEIEHAGEKFSNSKLYFGNEYSKADIYKAINKNYSIMHFALHGKSSMELRNDNYLLFKNGNNLDTIYAYEISKLQTRSTCAILSACDTSDGIWEKGEGQYSLSKAFLSAGFHNVIASKWKLDDQSSAYLIELFYQFLNEGFNIPTSLTLAKREMLFRNNQLSPYFWSGLTVFSGCCSL